jgi:hypothetical protein
MLYAILCYNDEAAVEATPKERVEATIANRTVATQPLADKGRLGPVARLMPTTAATTVRYGKETVVLDGPFAETKEQLLGFYVVDCESLEEVVELGRQMGEGGGTGTFEIRPLRLFRPGTLAP